MTKHITRRTTTCKRTANELLSYYRELRSAGQSVSEAKRAAVIIESECHPYWGHWQQHCVSLCTFEQRSTATHSIGVHPTYVVGSYCDQMTRDRAARAKWYVRRWLQLPMTNTTYDTADRVGAFDYHVQPLLKALYKRVRLQPDAPWQLLADKLTDDGDDTSAEFVRTLFN